MKKSLLALAVLGAFASAATAASSVTLYGRVDLSVAKNFGSSNKGIQNGSGSRLGLRGAEDLGGGLAAIFNIEHRFNADVGNQSDASRFWYGRSLVGLKGSFGQITLGREYTTSFLMSQWRNDPWAFDTVATLGANAAILGQGVSTVRNDNAITYNGKFGPVGVGFQIAEADQGNPSATRVKRPMNFALSYGAGPLAVNFGYEKSGLTTDSRLMNIGASYNFGAARVGGSYNSGKATGNTGLKSYTLYVTAPIGAGQLRAGYGSSKSDNLGTYSQKIAFGYHYSLSKRTTVYADFARDGKMATEKTAYDLGIKHNF